MSELNTQVQENEEKKHDGRHLARMRLMQALFVDEYKNQSWENFEIEFNQQALEEIRDRKSYYDEQIQKVAKERPLSDLARVDLSILRLILHEHEKKKTPVKVLINEGVELAKEFGAEQSYAFINAVLEKILLNEEKKDGE